MRKQITQAQIAKRAGVCQSAVSLVLSRRPHSMSPDTAAEILRIAQDMGYDHPALTVQAPAKTGNIGLLLKLGLLEAYLRAGWNQRLHHGAVNALEAAQYHLITAPFTDMREMPLAVEQRKVDGMLIVTHDHDPDWLKRMMTLIPIVLLNTRYDEVVADTVMPDNYQGTYDAIGHLVELGHRQITMFGIAARERNINSLERIDSFIEAKRSFNLPEWDGDRYIPATQNGGVEEVEQFAQTCLTEWMKLPTPPTAIITQNDVYGLGILKAARRLGISVPRQLSVIGVDNISLCEHSDPPLTTIEQPKEDMARQACRLLLNRIEDPDAPIARMTVATQLIIRDSTAIAPR